jgi:thymidylate synthase
MSEVCAISDSTISGAWSQAFLQLMKPGVTEVAPMVVSINFNSTSHFDQEVIAESLLDESIARLKASHAKYSKLQSVTTVANTIFPISMWNPSLPDNAEKLFERFDKAWPRIKRCKHNRRGSYFRRMTSFRNRGANDEPINQLRQVVETYRADIHRRSALQSSIFDPAFDHVKSRQLGFPCLQQVAFSPIGKTELRVTAFYANQYIFDRALGNYVGLCRLGTFMAAQLNLRFTGMTCIASVAQLGTPGKTILRPLEQQVTQALSELSRTAT